MLYQDEQMLLYDQFLSYNQVVFQPVVESGEALFPKCNMTQGRAFLTNHRIILLSAEEFQSKANIMSYIISNFNDLRREDILSLLLLLLSSKIVWSEEKKKKTLHWNIREDKFLL